MPVPHWFSHKFPEFEAKIVSDPHLPDSTRQAFFEDIVANCDDTSPDLDAQLAAVLERWHLKGEELQLEEDEKLGRAHSFGGVRKSLSSELQLNSYELDALMADEFESATNSERFDRLKYHLQDTPFHGIVWSFRNTTNVHSPFQDLEVETLPCRLGLNDLYLDPDRYIFLTLRLPDSETARRPTAVDAGTGWLSYWEPGGVTKPRPQCQATVQIGLPEVVHEPVPFHLIAPAY